MNLAQWKIESLIGPLYIVASEKGLKGIHFKKQKVTIPTSLSESKIEVKNLKQAVRQITEYFDKKRKQFDLPLDIEGTAFQKKVWNQLSKIPYGKTVSYKDVAVKIKNEKAVRAVGTANGRNPICIVVPCHRVIAADGTLGGYTGGLHIKTKLLALENTDTAN